MTLDQASQLLQGKEYFLRTETRLTRSQVTNTVRAPSPQCGQGRHCSREDDRKPTGARAMSSVGGTGQPGLGGAHETALGLRAPTFHSVNNVLLHTQQYHYMNLVTFALYNIKTGKFKVEKCVSCTRLLLPLVSTSKPCYFLLSHIPSSLSPFVSSPYASVSPPGPLSGIASVQAADVQPLPFPIQHTDQSQLL